MTCAEPLLITIMAVLFGLAIGWLGYLVGTRVGSKRRSGGQHSNVKLN